MSRTRPFSTIRRSLQLALAAQRGGVPAGEAVEQARAFAISRRQLLAAAGALPLVAACGSEAEPPVVVPPKVAVVGAASAGLHAAYLLKKKGIEAKVFEGSSRVGGRMFTARGMYADAQLIELGGELIDSNHTTMLQLAMDLGLPLDDLFSEPADIAKESFFFDGRLVPMTEIVEKFAPLAALMSAEVTAAEADETVFAATDEQSIAAWLAAQPVDDLIKRILSFAYVGEYGLEVEEQSVFNLLYLIDYEATDEFRIFGDSDERYHLHGGSDQIPTRLAADLGALVQLEHRLVRISESGTKIKLSLDRGGTSVEEEFDHVIVAIPFSLLREVEITLVFPAEKRSVIAELGYGTNAKLMSQYSSKPWRTTAKSNGSAFSDNGIQSLWETSRGQAGESGVLTHFVGGMDGVNIGMMTAEAQMLARLPLIDQIWAGTSAAYRPGSAVRMHWPTQPFTKGSYACYKPGQWAFFGTEKERVKNLHFAGEHTSEDFQGYMEGAAESGARAAQEILADLGLSTASALRARRRRRG